MKTRCALYLGVAAASLIALMPGGAHAQANAQNAAVTVGATDLGGAASLVPRDPINPAILSEVRADVNNDKRINATDVGGIRSLVPNDARTILDPICP